MCLHASEQWHSEVCGCCGADYLAVNPAAGFLAEEATAKELRNSGKERGRESASYKASRLEFHMSAGSFASFATLSAC